MPSPASSKSEAFLHKPGRSKTGRTLRPSLKARENLAMATAQKNGQGGEPVVAKTEPADDSTVQPNDPSAADTTMNPPPSVNPTGAQPADTGLSSGHDKSVDLAKKTPSDKLSKRSSKKTKSKGSKRSSVNREIEALLQQKQEAEMENLKSQFENLKLKHEAEAERLRRNFGSETSSESCADASQRTGEWIDTHFLDHALAKTRDRTNTHHGQDPRDKTLQPLTWPPVKTEPQNQVFPRKDAALVTKKVPTSKSARKHKPHEHFDAHSADSDSVIPDMNWIDTIDELGDGGLGNPNSVNGSVVCMDWSALAIQPKFDGSPLDWVTWSLRFKSKIHDNRFLTRSQKLSLLQDSLGEGPRSRIFGYLWDDRYYRKALQKLRQIYGDDHMVVQAHVTEIKAWHPKGKLSDISELTLLVSKLVQVFEVLGFQSDLHSQALLCDVANKLPDNLRKSWGRCVQRSGSPDIRTMERWLTREEEALRLGGAFPKPGGRRRDLSVSFNQLTPKPVDTGTLDSTAKSPPPRKPNPKIFCVFCNSSSHYIDKCPQFLTKSSAERLEWYTKENRCHRCSRVGHRARFCESRLRCPIEGCRRRHLRILHEALAGRTKRAVNQTTIDADLSDSGSSSTESVADQTGFETADEELVTRDTNALSNGTRTTQSLTADTKVFVQILPIRFHGENSSIDGFAMLDPGSQGCLLSKRLTTTLNLKGPTRRLFMKNVAQNIEPVSSTLVRLRVSDPSDPSSAPILVPEAWTLEKLNLPGQKVPRGAEGRPVWPHISDLDIPDVEGVEIDMLIGATCKLAMRKLDERFGPPGLPDAIRGPLGWSLLGGEDPITTSGQRIHQNYSNQTDLDLGDTSSALTKFWSIEDVGCKFTDAHELSIEDRKALDLMERLTKQAPDSRYEVPMLFKNGSIKLPNNFNQARSRYSALRSKLIAKPALRETYCKTMAEYISESYLVKMTPDEAARESDITRYLAHFGVSTPNKPKLRVVMDAALPFAGSSLNDKLVMGPFLTNTLVGVLLRFRVGAVAVSGDIKSMFYRIRIPEKSRDCLRVLWSETLEETPDTYQFHVHVFGAKCSPSCATYALRRCAQDQKEQFSEAVIREVMRSFYVDDYISSFTSEAEACAVTNDVIKLCAAGGFQLTKFVSTSQEVLNSVSDNHAVKVEIDLSMEAPVSRALGVQWHVKEDLLFFKVVPQRADLLLTKRSLLSLLCSLFDPLGFLGPFVMRGRVLIQHLWSIGVGWDEILEDNVASRFLGWIHEFEQLANFRLRRKYWPCNLTTDRIALHVFGDASEQAYASCCYLRVETPAGEVFVSFAMSRMRVAPIGKKSLSVPRLELQASVLCVRLVTLVREELDLEIDEVFFWSDSKTVLQYINNRTRRFKCFTGNRVAEILEESEPEQWRHCPGQLNPSDLATRGMSATELTAAENPWINGPNFLWQPVEFWPPRLIPAQIRDDDAEIRSLAFNQITMYTPLFDPTRFSSLDKLLSVTAWVMRFCQYPRPPKIPTITASERVAARKFWILQAQKECFATEIFDVTTGRTVASSSSLKRLRPFVEDSTGLLRVGGRLAEANVPYNMKHQIVLPKQHHLTTLLITEVHTRLLHAGVEQVVSKIREKYWVPSLRSTVKSVIRECPTCRRELTKPVMPKMSDLPPARLEESTWAHTGMDAIGPFYVKQNRKRPKRWVIIFTAMSIRSVHFELVPSLSADSFIMALRRFIARRGEVHNLYSDQGTNFKGADPELRAAVSQLNANANFQKYLTCHEIIFHYNPPQGSHMSGTWERLVKSCKKSLRIVLRDRVVEEEVLSTTLCETESAMNARPLSYVADEAGITPLTPNHFLHQAPTVVTPLLVSDDKRDHFRKKWAQSQLISQHLWARWRKEYLHGITVADKWHQERRSLALDDVVLLVDHNAPRGCWPLGRVVETHLSRDGRIRSATVKTKSGNLVRPASKICLLEEANDAS